MNEPRILHLTCTYCGALVKRYASSQINPKTGKMRTVIKCPDCRQADPEFLFNLKVDKSAGPDGCWIWTGAKTKDMPGGSGHGMFRSPSWPQEQYAHRFAWFFKFKQKPPKGLRVRHQCPGKHNPLCVNPKHLALGTHAQNVQDSIEQGTHVSLHNHGESHYMAKISEEAVRDIHANYRYGTAKMLADKWGIAVSTVRGIGQRRSWRHVK